MQLNSVIFVVFFSFIFVAYWINAKGGLWWQNSILLLGSLSFFAIWNWKLLIVLIGIGLADYGLGIAFDSSFGRRRRGWLLGISLAVNIGALIYFKYLNFFSESLQRLLQFFGLQFDQNFIAIVAPLGLSFLVLRSISYSVGRYKGSLSVERNPLNYLNFLLYFPQLASGPIERARNFLPQLSQAREFDKSMISDGLRQILIGYMKKLVISDNIARAISPLFGNPTGHSSVELTAGILLYSIQIYADFSAYSDIAIGCSSLLGIRSATNFSFPYFSRNIAEFWRRWHISLSTFLFEYIYYPLIGSSLKSFNRLVAILVTFGISGLWHGPSWNFVVWGCLHGLFYVPMVLFPPAQPESRIAGGKGYLPSFSELNRIAITFLSVTFAWVFFRVKSVSEGLIYLKTIFTGGDGTAVEPLPWLIISLSILFMLFEWLQRRKSHLLDIKRFPQVARWSIYVMVILVIIVFGEFGANEFVYVQF